MGGGGVGGPGGGGGGGRDCGGGSGRGGRAGPGAGGAFGELQASPWRQIGMQFLFMGATVGVVMGGVKAGLERLNKVLMPALALMLVGLLIYSVRLDGFRESAAFMFSFKAEKLTWGGVLEAVGHAFFTLSLGMGAIITYGSYLGTDRGLVRTTVAVCAVDTLVALTAGVVIFAVVFSHAGMEPSAGPGLMFATLPTLMADLPGARAVASVFFLLVLFAALTSAISLLEVAVAYWDEKHGTRRGPTALVIGLVVTAAGVPSALSTNVLADVTVAGLTFLDVVDKLTSQYVLPIGGMLTALFLGWVLGPRAVRAIVGEGREFFAQGLLWCCRVVAPAAVLVIVAQTVWEDVRPAPAAEVVPAEPEGAAAPAEGGGAGGE